MSTISAPARPLAIEWAKSVNYRNMLSDMTSDESSMEEEQSSAEEYHGSGTDADESRVERDAGDRSRRL